MGGAIELNTQRFAYSLCISLFITRVSMQYKQRLRELSIDILCEFSAASIRTSSQRDRIVRLIAAPFSRESSASVKLRCAFNASTNYIDLARAMNPIFVCIKHDAVASCGRIVAFVKSIKVFQMGPFFRRKLFGRNHGNYALVDGCTGASSEDRETDIYSFHSSWSSV
jgi:hypothetical protein